MKKGFFLLEALLACVLLSLLVGAVMHHYAQWSSNYRNALEQAKAFTVLMTLIEQRTESCSGSERYTITKKKILVDAPTVSVPTFICPPPHCIEIRASWDDGSVACIMSGGIDGA